MLVALVGPQPGVLPHDRRAVHLRYICLYCGIFYAAEGSPFLHARPIFVSEISHRIQRGFRARHLRRRTQRRSEMGPLPAIRETSSMRDSSIRSMGDVEGDDTRPDLSGDSSGARLSLSAAAERIASSLSGGYQEYKE